MALFNVDYCLKKQIVLVELERIPLLLSLCQITGKQENKR